MNRHTLRPVSQPLIHHATGNEPRWFCTTCLRSFREWPGDEECTGRPTEDAA